ncbi:hypothetical protein MMB17_04655 [Methylobacterium organophilum]|uniref:hypothetical protein n=1 Tax=Methylobacterium organophilum TaxID=410 RepID=UPI001F13FDF0|nr:hypothetical protein [Methylobacterium organophilum]UMY18626.1 hypothetical protein MMB17_04655 [Methylobacterium organophilum]
MSTETVETVRVIDSAVDCPEIPIVVGAGNAKVVMWPENGAIYRTFHLISLHASDKTIPLSHKGDSVYYVVSGSGVVRSPSDDFSAELVEGSMVHIDGGDSYTFEAHGNSGMSLLGGPCPADLELYANLRARG